MKMLKVGIIGAGMAFERLHYPAYQQLTDRYQIAALCDLDQAKAPKWGNQLNLDHSCIYTDFHQMLLRSDLDVIDIMVPIGKNFAVAEAVAKQLAGRGKGIICEKPLAPTFEQAQSARGLAQKYQLPIMIAENFRYNQEMDLIRDLVRTQRIGDVYYFIQNHTVDFPAGMWQDQFAATEWRQHPDFPGGAFTDTGVHDLAGLRHIFGPVDQLQAFGRPQTADFSPYSVFNVNLRFKNGIIGQYTFFCTGKEMQRPLIGLRIFGSQGMIYLEERDCGTINLAFNDGHTEQIPYQPQKGYYNELINFHNALTGQEPISVPPEMEFGDLKTVEDVLKSIQEGQIVSVDQAAAYQPAYNQPPSGQPNFLQ